MTNKPIKIVIPLGAPPPPLPQPIIPSLRSEPPPEPAAARYASARVRERLVGRLRAALDDARPFRHSDPAIGALVEGVEALLADAETRS